MRKVSFILFIVFALFFTGCASHPVVHPGSLKKGERVWGYSVAAENIFPVMWFRKGLDQDTELGYRIGLPIYGTGVDLSRVVMRKENTWDAMNFAWSYNPNRNFDVTYYRFKESSGGLLSKLKKKQDEKNLVTDEKNIEEEKRICEKNEDFGNNFIKLSRNVYKNNDKRAKIKSDINKLLGSNIKEVKSY